MNRPARLRPPARLVAAPRAVVTGFLPLARTLLLLTAGAWTAPRSEAQAPAQAQAPGPGQRFPLELATTSQSGQFVVVGPRVPGLSPPREFQPGSAPRTLTPQTLAVACDRIKTETLRVLSIPDVWRTAGARIHVTIEPTLRTNLPVPIEASPYEATWKFQVRVPSSLSEERLTRAIVQAVLLDLANRAGNQRAAEAPLWLTEGVTRFVLQSSVEGTLPAPETRTSMEVRRQETLAQVREQLSRFEPPSFHELSQPDLDAMPDRAWQRYAAAAHLCLHELRRLPEGDARLRAWIFGLQNHWNWQTGFIESFQPIFRSLLDTEKWWAITLANFTGRDAAQAWPAEFTLRKLDEALQPVGILPGAGSRARRMPLAEIIADWDFQRQLPVLRQLLQQLHAIRINAPPDLRPILFRYIDLVDTYLDSRSRVGLTPLVRGQAPVSPKLVVREATQRLRDLDAERAQAAQDLTPSPAPQPPSPSASLPVSRPRRSRSARARRPPP